jgi:D-arabinan exo alpha-(1,3)/(1,5)-arabinofuranosidase (non-reducing end)
MKNLRRFSFLCFGAFALSTFAQGPIARPGDGLGIARLKDFRARRVSSNNRFIGSNDDSKRIMPGATLVLADLPGPGVVTHLWVTIADSEFAWPRLLRLRVYYDGHKTPSVDAPLGDFFGVGHGYERDLNSSMVRDSSFGRARNSYWPMPFRKFCRITVTNEGRRFVYSFYDHVDWQKRASLPSDVGYFHAYYRQEMPAAPGRNYEILNINGRGQYVGTVLNIVQSEVGWFGEGDDLFYVDGENKPSIDGTGTEDYFNQAWGLRITDGEYTGTTIAEGEGVGARLSAYRWHLPDPVPFSKSLRFEIEHKGWTYNADGTVRSGFEERPDFFSSVAFWYQAGVNEGSPEPPYGEARLPLGNADQIEVENSIKDVTTEKGKASVQKEVFWGKGLLFFEGEGAGAKVNIPIDVPADGRYEMIAEIAESSDYGDYVALLDGKLTNSVTQTWAASNVPPPGTEIIRNFNPETYVAADHLLGWFDLHQGRHTLTFVCVGKDAASDGYNLGVDDVVLEKIPPTSGSQTAHDEERSMPMSAPAAPSTGIIYRGRPLSYYSDQLRRVPSTARPSVLRDIGAFGPDAAPAIPELTMELADSDPEARAAAAWALTQVGPKGASAVPALSHALADESPRVRGLAAIALQEVGPQAKAAVPELIKALDDPEATVRASAADALGAIGPSAVVAVHPLSKRLLAPGEQVFVLRSVATALGDIGPARVMRYPR